MTDTTLNPVTIGVAGGTGSGKTTVANRILELVSSSHIAFLPHDAYYKDFGDLTSDERATINFDHPDSLETSLMVEHILQLKAGQPIERPVYDFTNDRRTNQTIRVEPQPIIFVEGILIYAEKALRELLDIKIYVDTDADLRFIRRLQRDIAERGRDMKSVIEQYLNTVRPMHRDFVEPSKRYADVIIPRGGFNTVAIDIIANRISRLLTERGETD